LSSNTIIFGTCSCKNLREHHKEVLVDIVAMIQHGESGRAIVEITKEISDINNGRFED